MRRITAPMTNISVICHWDFRWNRKLVLKMKNTSFSLKGKHCRMSLSLQHHSRNRQRFQPRTSSLFSGKRPYNPRESIFNVANKICLVTDPRPNHPIGQTYTVDCLGNVVGAKPIQYNNQSVETLMELASKSIKAHSLI